MSLDILLKKVRYLQNSLTLYQFMFDNYLDSNSIQNHTFETKCTNFNPKQAMIDLIQMF